ncbi:MAG: L-histidine N(alpha)-methyltransferase [Dehalococcoidia bacterium]|nr:L-histidine N(alpha)-methyltransferase [Dehalococcoidia bacterium]
MTTTFSDNAEAGARALPGYVDEVIEGLSTAEKTLPCKLFYDERGSGLFDQICELDEYYVTRTENALMGAHAGEMAEAIGPGCLLIEYGAGSSTKIRSLLDHLRDPAAFVPVDISGEHLVRAADELKASYPDVEINPLVADFTGSFDVPAPLIEPARSVVYFPGSTIGNFAPGDASKLLKTIAERVGLGGGLLIGVDLDKDPDVLHAAYNDRKGVTAAFNLNLLVRLNREAGADFNLSCFTHRAAYNPESSRIEMRLYSDRRQTAQIAGHRFDFDMGESILTEYSHKYTIESFGRIAAEAGFQTRQVWTDADGLFSVQYLELD